MESSSSSSREARLVAIIISVRRLIGAGPRTPRKLTLRACLSHTIFPCPRTQEQPLGPLRETPPLRTQGCGGGGQPLAGPWVRGTICPVGRAGSWVWWALLLPLPQWFFSPEESLSPEQRVFPLHRTWRVGYKEGYYSLVSCCY